MLKTALAVTKETWQLWQGTWFSIFLMTLTPGVFGEKWYFLTTLLMAGMLGGSICVLMHTVLCRYISRAKENRYLRGICTLTVLFLTFQTFVSPVLALYWYNGSLHYVFMEAVLFFAVSALLCLETSEQKSKKILWMILSATVRRGEPVDRLTVGDPDRTADGMGVFPEKEKPFLVFVSACLQPGRFCV